MNNYEELKCIGNGSFGQVYLVKSKQDKQKYAIKSIRIVDIEEKHRKNMENEVALMQQLGHPNIVAYKDSFTEDGNLNIVMSYCEGGDMYNRIKETEGKHFPENVSSKWGIFISSLKIVSVGLDGSAGVLTPLLA